MTKFFYVIFVLSLGFASFVRIANNIWGVEIAKCSWCSMRWMKTGKWGL